MSKTYRPPTPIPHPQPPPPLGLVCVLMFTKELLINHSKAIKLSSTWKVTVRLGQNVKNVSDQNVLASPLLQQSLVVNFINHFRLETLKIEQINCYLDCLETASIFSSKIIFVFYIF